MLARAGGGTPSRGQEVDNVRSICVWVWAYYNSPSRYLDEASGRRDTARLGLQGLQPNHPLLTLAPPIAIGYASRVRGLMDS